MIRKYVEMPFVKVVVISALLFFIIVTIFKFLIALFDDKSVTDIITTFSSKEYLISNLLGALVYGVIITYFYKRKYKKQ